MHYLHGQEGNGGIIDNNGLLQIHADTSLGYSDNIVVIREPIDDAYGHVRVGNTTAPRRWGALACAYLGQPAS